MRDTGGAIDWYRTHEVFPESLGFDPDGMCLRICRTARDLPPVFPSAVAAQEATPEEYRVHRVRDLRRGMVLYFDDPADANPFGHIVTMVGSVVGADPDSLRDILVRTNSVVANEIVVVRADYFPKHWGDQFQFGATWLNGQAFPDFVKPEPRPKPGPAIGKNPTNLNDAVEALQKAIRHHKSQGHVRLVNALRRDLKSLRETIDRFNG
jgi:hypothetical protein